MSPPDRLEGDRLVAGKRAEEDAAELALRPQTLDDFIGQKQVRENLKIFIAAGDKASLSRPAGVGPKLAARLATELKDKAAAFGVAPAPARAASSTAPVTGGSVNEDAVSALVNLGYRRVEAFGAVARVTQRLGEAAQLDAVIRAGLQELSR